MIRDHVKYVPAGLESWPGRIGQIFVKLGKNEHMSIHKGMGYKIIRLRDRTLHIVYESSKQHRLLDEHLDCDYVVPYQNPVELRKRVDLVLVNPLHAGVNFRNVFKPHKIKIISDSGGFQLLVGLSEFIHPDEPVDFYNKHTDVGMSLDLPMPYACEPLFFDAATKLMLANDKYMIPQLNDGKTLALVIHGSTLERRKRRLEALYRKSDVVAIAGLNSNVDITVSKQLTGLSNALYVISQTREFVKYYHVLGVTSRFWYIIYALLVGTGYVKNIGGDSVSHRMSAITGSYKQHLAYNSGAGTIQIEKLNKKSVCTSCTCALCQAVSDLNILADFQLCETHQIWYSEQEKDLICDSVESYLKGHLTLKQVCDQWLAKGQYPIVAQAAEYINAVVDKGFHPLKVKGVPTLFDDDDRTALDPAIKERYVRIIKNYENFHKKKFL